MLQGTSDFKFLAMLEVTVRCELNAFFTMRHTKVFRYLGEECYTLVLKYPSQILICICWESFKLEIKHKGMAAA